MEGNDEYLAYMKEQINYIREKVKNITELLNSDGLHWPVHKAFLPETSTRWGEYFLLSVLENDHAGSKKRFDQLDKNKDALLKSEGEITY